MNSSSELNKEKTELSKIETKEILKNLKSDYFLQKLFNNLLKKKSLDIIKYNNDIKNRLNISIKDYKEYLEIYSTIELEIKHVKNNDPKFINIDEETGKYYHIYFDDNKEETETKYLYKNENVEKFRVIIDYQIKSFEGLFWNINCIEYVYFKKFFRNNITNMGSMFYRCSSLKGLNLSNFNTNNVTNMESMFEECSSLKELNLSNFNTNNVTNMRLMFCGCSSLKELTISNFNTNNVTNMESMFEECSSLIELNLSNFNTNNVTNMKSMFYNCSSLKELNISNFNINNVTDMRLMFCGCSSLKELSISNFNTNNVTRMGLMFYQCSEQFQNKIKAQYKNIINEAFGSY